MVARFLVPLILLTTSFTFAVSPALAGAVGLRWHSSAGASGYRVHYGPSPGNYTHTVDTGSSTEVTIQGLQDCQDWFFAVTAYNTFGESGYSNEVITWTRPSVVDVTPDVALQGDRLTITLSGSSFRPGAEVEIDNPSVVLGSPTTHCDRIQISATIEPTAENVPPARTGSFALTVSNPEGPSATVSDAFEVLMDPARFDVNRSDEVTQGRLDGKDTVWLSRRFKSCVTAVAVDQPCERDDPLYDPDFDFNGDGWVDGEELAFLASNLGGCWDGAAWSVNACPR